jgi:HD-like signal output (HDOD) protein
VLVIEPNEQIVEGYRRLLRVFSSAWSVSFAADTGAAMARVDANEVDVVIVDAKCPGLDGFLLELRSRKPLVTRIVLAGAEVKNEVAVQLTVVAHQVLKKPFIPPQLFELIERTCRVTEALANERLKVVLGQLGALPALPQTYAKLVELTSNPDCSLDVVSTVVERDAAVTAAVLRIINSAYFGLPRRVSSVRETVRFLGIQPLKNIVLTVEVFEGLASGKAAQGLQDEALARACAMREVLGRTPLAESAFAAGILADVGGLMLATRLPIDAAAITRLTNGGALPWKAEAERLGCTHADIGAAILAKWNLPNPMVEAVALHHQPPENVPAPTVATALALVTAIEFSHRTRDEVRRELRASAERLVATFPTVTLEQLDRYFSRGEEAVA